MNLFFRNPAIIGAQIYIGLLIFCGYLLYDTQVWSCAGARCCCCCLFLLLVLTAVGYAR
jgi:hypothetical protein